MSKLYDDAVADLGDAYRETITVGREVFVKTLQYAVANKEIIFGNIVAASLGRWIPGTLAKYLASLIMSSLPVNERLPYLKEITEDELRTQLIIANAIPDDHSAAPPGGGMEALTLRMMEVARLMMRNAAKFRNLAKIKGDRGLMLKQMKVSARRPPLIRNASPAL